MDIMEVKPRMITPIVQEIRQLTEHVLFFICTLPKGTDFSFVAGQYATLIIDPVTRRQYSFASPPSELPALSFVVDTAPMGPGSQFFLRLRKGDSMQMLAPLGTFMMKDSPRKKVLVATGTGIAPFRSMLRNEISNCSLYWGLRFEKDIYWREEFEALAGQYTGFQFSLTLSKPSAIWRGYTGHVTERMCEIEKDAGFCDYYICGGGNMIRDVVKCLSERGVKKEQILTDKYY